MMTRFGRLAVVGSVATLLGLSACSGGADADGTAATGQDSLTVAVQDEITNLMVGQLAKPTDRFMGLALYNGLLKFAPGTTDVVPDLAKDYETSTDGKTLTFELRDDVEFSDGYGTLTAQDVVATFEYQMDEVNGTVDRSLFAPVESVEAPDSSTVVIKLSQPSPGFVTSVLAWQPGYITSAKALEELGADAMAKDPVGTGPYVLEELSRGQGALLAINSAYFGEPPSMKQVEVEVIPDQQVALMAVASGEIDVATVTQTSAFEQLDSVRDSLQVITSDISGWADLLFVRSDEGPLQDVRVRQAIAHAIDRGAILQSLEGMATPLKSVLVPAIAESTEDVTQLEYDAARAQSLLEEAGISEPSELSLEVGYRKSTLYEPLALMVTDQLRQFGITVEAKLVSDEQWPDYQQEGTWDLLVLGLARVSADDVMSPYLAADGSRNLSGWSHAEADTLIKTARQTVDDAERKELYAQAQEIVAQEVPILPMDVSQSIIVATDGLDGVIPNPAYNGLYGLDTIQYAD